MNKVMSMLLIAGALSIGGMSTGGAQQANGNLNAADVRRLLVGQEVIHEGDGKGETTSFLYGVNGEYDSSNGRIADGGRYTVEKDGRLCWTGKAKATGCFQYYRAKGVLRVRNPAKGTEIGRVTVKPWYPAGKS